MSSEHGILNLDQENTDIRPGDFIDFQVGYGDSTVFFTKNSMEFAMENWNQSGILRVEVRFLKNRFVDGILKFDSTHYLKDFLLTIEASFIFHCHGI